MFTEYWVKIKIANPNLDDADAKMTISVANFNKQLKKAYEAGMKAGVKEGIIEGERAAIKRVRAAKDFEKIKQPDSKSYDSTMDLFSGIFGNDLGGNLGEKK